ncbi:MAG: glycosyltransferase [Bacteroidetes bacterium]|nr:glycosyltransferase [Bacteroidota bacterium]
MKILHVAEAFEGGIIEIMRLLSIHLPEFEHVIVHGNRKIHLDSIKATFPENVHFIKWHSAKREISISGDLKAYRELIKIFRKNLPFDALHLYSSKAGILGRIAGKSLGIKNILYSPQGASFERQDISGFKRKIYGFIEKGASKLPGQIVAASKSEQKSFENLGIPAICINNGVSIDLNFHKQFPENEFTIVNAARISEQKNPALFNSIAEAFKDNPLVKFVWVGDGPLKNELTSPNIQITGWVGKAEVERNMKQAHLYLSTALWEGLPLSVLEAMKFNLPLLLSRCVGNVDLVEENVNGYCFTAKEEAIQCINHYLDDKNLMHEHGACSYNKIKQDFSIDQMKNKFKALYISDINIDASPLLFHVS